MLDEIIEKFGDHGADSSRRDRFQEHYAAHWCIKMLFDSTISEVICEYGEDIVVNCRGVYELHQVKTKQESVNDWKVQDLIPIIGKMFAMIPYFGDVSKCCFVSNEGASGILYEFKTIINQSSDLWKEAEKGFFDNFCKNHSRKILHEMKRVDPDCKAASKDVNEWLLKLEILTDFHHMEYVEDTNLRDLRRYLEHTGQSSVTYTDIELADAYDRLIGLVGKATIGRTRKEKTVGQEQVKQCLKHPKLRRSLYTFPTKREIDRALGRTRLEKKLNLGGFTPLYVEKAREEMVSVLNQARGWDFGEASEVLEDIRFRVRHFCVDSYDRVCSTYPNEEALGRKMVDDIKKELPRLVDYYCETGLPFIDEIFLLGIAMELTGACKLYWSQHRQL